jgi:hypothetical protein
MVMPVYGIDSTKYLCKLLRSADSGATWAVYGTIATNAALDYTEPYVIKLADNSLFATIRNNTDDRFYNSTSTDGGATWSALTLAVNPGSGRSSMILNADGVIRMAYRTSPSTTRLTAVVASADSGATWTPATAFGTTGIYTYAQWIEPIDGQRAVGWSEEPAGGWLGSVSAVYFRKTTVWPSTLSTGTGLSEDTVVPLITRERGNPSTGLTAAITATWRGPRQSGASVDPSACGTGWRTSVSGRR